MRLLRRSLYATMPRLRRRASANALISCAHFSKSRGGRSFANSLISLAGRRSSPATSLQYRSIWLSVSVPLIPVWPSHKCVSSWRAVKDQAGLASWPLMTIMGAIVSARANPRNTSTGKDPAASMHPRKYVNASSMVLAERNFSRENPSRWAIRIVRTSIGNCRLMVPMKSTGAA